MKIPERHIFTYTHPPGCNKCRQMHVFRKGPEVWSSTPSLRSRAVFYSPLLFPFPTSEHFLFLHNWMQFLTLAGIYVLWNMYYTYLGSNHSKELPEGQKAGELLLTARVASARDSPRSHPQGFIGEHRFSSHHPSNPTAQVTGNLLRVNSSTLV